MYRCRVDSVKCDVFLDSRYRYQSASRESTCLESLWGDDLRMEDEGSRPLHAGDFDTLVIEDHERGDPHDSGGEYRSSRLSDYEGIRSASEVGQRSFGQISDTPQVPEYLLAL